jgi:hypothetical protein
MIVMMANICLFFNTRPTTTRHVGIHQCTVLRSKDSAMVFFSFVLPVHVRTVFSVFKMLFFPLRVK